MYHYEPFCVVRVVVFVELLVIIDRWELCGAIWKRRMQTFCKAANAIGKSRAAVVDVQRGTRQEKSSSHRLSHKCAEIDDVDFSSFGLPAITVSDVAPAHGTDGHVSGIHCRHWKV